jgi:hypothetical protein
MSDAPKCAVCGKPIDPDESRFVDRKGVIGAKVHVHLNCKQRDSALSDNSQ